MLRELVTRPISAALALIELPVTMQRSLKQANDLMEASRRQLEAMQHQTEEALQQAERMNDLLGRVVKLTEPLEIAQRGGEYVGGRLKRVIFGEGDRIERAVEDAEAAAEDAEFAASESHAVAERVEDEVEGAAPLSEADTRAAAERLEEARKLAANPVATEGPAPSEPETDGWSPAGSRHREDDGGLDVADSGTVRVIPNQPPPGDSE